MTKRVLFLFSDTGGGHRSAFQAIRDALILRYGEENFVFDPVDVFRECKWPLNKQPEMYPWMVNNTKPLWGLMYYTVDGRRRANLFSRMMYFNNRANLKRMVREHPADVVVCTHSVINRPSMRAMMTLERRPPFLTVVTDLVTTPTYWYDRSVERCFVPTQAAYDRAIEVGMRPRQLRITGLPVNPRFSQGLVDKAAARAEFGWDAHLPAILMVAGGEGMGPLYETADALDQQRLNCQIAIITGKNEALRKRLESRLWHTPHHIYGYVSNHHEMPRLMAAADIIVTKAGPSTIAEACIAGLPMILSDAIPGQEDGNIVFVEQNQAGVFAPRPQLVAQTAAQWLAEGPQALQRRAANARRLARPNAVWQIAEEVWEYAHHRRIRTRRRDMSTFTLRFPPRR